MEPFFDTNKKRGRLSPSGISRSKQYNTWTESGLGLAVTISTAGLAGGPGLGAAWAPFLVFALASFAAGLAAPLLALETSAAPAAFTPFLAAVFLPAAGAVTFARETPGALTFFLGFFMVPSSNRS